MVEFPWSRQNSEERRKREERAEQEHWEKNLEMLREQYHQLKDQLESEAPAIDANEGSVSGPFRFSQAPKTQAEPHQFSSEGGIGITAVHKGVAAQQPQAAIEEPIADYIGEIDDIPYLEDIELGVPAEAPAEKTAAPIFHNVRTFTPPVTPVAPAAPAAEKPTVAAEPKRTRGPKKPPAPKDELSVQVGQTIKALMKENGYNNKMLAEKLGYDKGTVGNYLTGERKASISFVIDVAKLFNVSSDYILGISDYRKSESSGLEVAAVGLSEPAVRKLLANKDNRSYGLLISYLIERLPDTIVRRIMTSLRVGRNRLHSANIVTEPFSFRQITDERGNKRYVVNTDDAQALLTEHILAQFRRFFTQMANDEELLNQMFRTEDLEDDMGELK